MPTGFTAWPEHFAARYRERGYWTGEDFPALLDRVAGKFGEREAVVGTGLDGSPLRLTYGGLRERSLRLAAGLHGLGLRRGERVVVQCGNHPEFVVLLFALSRIGAIPVFALPAHRRAEIGHFCSAAGAVAYFHGGDADNAEAVSGAVPHVREIGELFSLPAGGPLPEPPAASEVALFQLSGGSTGLPKLIPRTHDDYAYSVRASADICGLTESTVFLCVLPAAHNFALSSPGVLGVLHAGGTVVLAPDGSPDTAFPLIEAEGVTIAALVPPLAQVWLTAATSATADLSTLDLVQVGGARLAPAVAERIGPVLGARLQQVFGMAEGLVCYTRDDDPPELVNTTQGRPICDADDEILVVDDEDREVAPGEEGHLLTRGPYTIRGYFDAEAHNRNAFTVDGFYRTGDLVRRTETGHLMVTGRAKDQINRGGEKIAAAEVEQVLLAHPGVADAAVVSVPDEHLGERSCAYVVARESLPPKGSLIRAHVRAAGLAAYKIPDKVVFVEALPRTPVGKVDKKSLRERHRKES
ncbi:AMP-binding protein [Phytomonospora sp. NPDC050363]|uniref:(2,3-dihydroxybenzoyl)adenylate synthase n=1 Tax=Phytomonospora sp. NPDC050363 TaxID=3155642 RepID=UPI00340265E1